MGKVKIDPDLTNAAAVLIGANKLSQLTNTIGGLPNFAFVLDNFSLFHSHFLNSLKD
jgi:hypothetical protein